MSITRSIVRREPLTPVGRWPDSTSPLMRRIYTNRGISEYDQIEHRLTNLLSPKLMGGMAEAAQLVADAIINQEQIIIAGDYDCDGATGTTVLYRGLRMLGAKNVRFILPDRFKHGYGLSVALVEEMPADVQMVITVDSGVASHAGVLAAKARGFKVVITDHHLPGDTLPEADAIVNPNLAGDEFPSKALAGVGVGFYLLINTRARLIEMGVDVEQADLRELLDIVALGTVADLVSLDFNNRILVDSGIQRIRSGRVNPGIKALLELGGRSYRTVTAADFGFVVGPRLNAAGRLENMSLGIECLIADSAEEAENAARRLDEINQERKTLQSEMAEQAEVIAMESQGDNDPQMVVVVYDPNWHSGIVGLVASKLKENLHRPVFAFAPGNPDTPDELRGSGRSIPGFHLRDVLAEVDVLNPGLIDKFGGHAMAAGLSIHASRIDDFKEAFRKVAERHLKPEMLEAVIYSDGELAPSEINLNTAVQLRFEGPWGQNFPEPAFDNVFDIVQWRVLGKNHLKMLLEDPRTGDQVEGILFFADDYIPPPNRARLCYELSVNEWQQRQTLQLMIKHIEPM